MKIGVIGASGFLGSNLAYFIGHRKGIDLVGISQRDDTYFQETLRYGSMDHLETRLTESNVTHLINCAALTSHEKAEEDPRLARATNSILAGKIGEISESLGIKLCHVSTDAVFDGKSAHLYGETDVATPTSVYGQTKLEGESLVSHAHSKSLILRTNFFGWSPLGNKGILDFFFQRLRAREETTGFVDYRVSSVYVGDLAEVIVRLFESSSQGVYHVGSSLPVSKFDFGVGVADVFGLDRSLVVQGSMLDHSSITSRGPDLGLSTEKISNLLGQRMPTTLEGLQRAKLDQQSIFGWFGRKL